MILHRAFFAPALTLPRYAGEGIRFSPSPCAPRAGEGQGGGGIKLVVTVHQNPALPKIGC